MWLRVAVALSVAMMTNTASAQPSAGDARAKSTALDSADYRRGFLDGYRARSLSDRKTVDRPHLWWRNRGITRPLDGYRPYWRNRPRAWERPGGYAERRFRYDRRRSAAEPGVTEATLHGEPLVRAPE